MRGKNIKNALLRFFFAGFERRIESKLSDLQNETLKDAGLKVLDLAGNMAELLTDSEPNNKAQISQFVKDNKAQIIQAGKAILLLGISEATTPQLQQDAKGFFEAIELEADA